MSKTIVQLDPDAQEHLNLNISPNSAVFPTQPASLCFSFLCDDH